MTFKQLANSIGLNVSRRTIARALKRLGFRRCIACPRPFITEKQAKVRQQWAADHQDWTVNAWARVVWTDECSFETGQRGRIWITRNSKEKYCSNCIKRNYRSGRCSFMVWGAIGWGYKSKLVFMQKNDPKDRGKILFPSIYCVNCTDIFRDQFQSICEASP